MGFPALEGPWWMTVTQFIGDETRAEFVHTICGVFSMSDLEESRSDIDNALCWLLARAEKLSCSDEQSGVDLRFPSKIGDRKAGTSWMLRVPSWILTFSLVCCSNHLGTIIRDSSVNQNIRI